MHNLNYGAIVTHISQSYALKCLLIIMYLEKCSHYNLDYFHMLSLSYVSCHFFSFKHSIFSLMSLGVTTTVLVFSPLECGLC